MPNQIRPRSRAALARAVDLRVLGLVITVGLLSGLVLLLSIGTAWQPAS